jgi:hypothetical protein
MTGGRAAVWVCAQERRCSESIRGRLRKREAMRKREGRKRVGRGSGRRSMFRQALFRRSVDIKMLSVCSD